MELRQLEAFAALATELHFGRAAASLHVAQPTLSELIQRLERELGTPLFTRTTRRVALTEAGTELQTRAISILADVRAATAAVQRIAIGDTGTVRVGTTPPVTPVLGPHLRHSFAQLAPDIQLVETQMWLPTLLGAVVDGTIDVAITCGASPQSYGVATEPFCAEPLLVGLRPDHRLTHSDTVPLEALAHDVLGTTSASLFPAWAAAQQQILDSAGLTPPHLPLTATDLAATRWTDQPELDWIMLTGSLAAGHTDTVVRPTSPAIGVTFTVHWNAGRTQPPAVARFVHHALTSTPPLGWSTGSRLLRR